MAGLTDPAAARGRHCALRANFVLATFALATPQSHHNRPPTWRQRRAARRSGCSPARGRRSARGDLRLFSNTQRLARRHTRISAVAAARARGAAPPPRAAGGPHGRNTATPHDRWQRVAMACGARALRPSSCACACSWGVRSSRGELGFNLIRRPHRISALFFGFVTPRLRFWMVRGPPFLTPLRFRSVSVHLC